jgi:hypothetical protein
MIIKLDIAWMIAAAGAGMLGFHVITYVMVGCKGEGSLTGLISALPSGGRPLLEGKGPYISVIFRLVKSYNSSTYYVYIINIYIYIYLFRVTQGVLKT